MTYTPPGDNDKGQAEFANARQPGGDHYSAEYQHWDFVEDHGLGYLEAAATKYVSRWNKKGTPLLDVEKALHYTEKLMELHKVGRRLPRGVAPLAAIMRFSEANNLGSKEDNIVCELARWSQLCDLKRARDGILRLLEEARKLQDDRDLINAK